MPTFSKEHRKESIKSFAADVTRIMQSNMNLASLNVQEQLLIIIDGEWQYKIHVNKTRLLTTFRVFRSNFGFHDIDIKKSDRVKECGEGYVLDFFAYGRAVGKGYEDETCTLVDNKFQFIYYTKF